MSTDNITLGELAKSFKDDSVNGICEYLNKKGFTIPKDPDYVLTESELKAIYPKVITPSKNNAEEKDSKSNLQQTNQSDKAISKDTSIKSDNNRIITKKEKKEKKLIGIVKFYDSIKDFGVSCISPWMPTTCLTKNPAQAEHEEGYVCNAPQLRPESFHLRIDGFC